MLPSVSRQACAAGPRASAIHGKLSKTAHTWFHMQPAATCTLSSCSSCTQSQLNLCFKLRLAASSKSAAAVSVSLTKHSCSMTVGLNVKVLHPCMQAQTWAQAQQPLLQQDYVWIWTSRSVFGHLYTPSFCASCIEHRCT